MDRGDRQITSEYIFRGLNFKAVNLVCLQKKTKGGAPFLVLEFKGIIVVCCSIWMYLQYLYWLRQNCAR